MKNLKKILVLSVLASSAFAQDANLITVSSQLEEQSVYGGCRGSIDPDQEAEMVQTVKLDLLRSAIDACRTAGGHASSASEVRISKKCIGFGTVIQMQASADYKCEKPPEVL